VILLIFTHFGCIMHNCDAKLLEALLLPDTRDFKKLRRADGTRRKHNFFASTCTRHASTVQKLHRNCAFALKHHALDVGMCQDFRIVPAASRLEIASCRAAPDAIA
jgi:hypothetical protein